MENHPIVIADRTGIIRYWSAGAEKIFGHAAGHAVGRSLDLIVPAEYAQAHWAGFHKAMATGAAAAEGRAVPFPARAADGRTAMAQGRLTLLRAPDGPVIGAAVIFSWENAP